MCERERQTDREANREKPKVHKNRSQGRRATMINTIQCPRNHTLLIEYFKEVVEIGLEFLSLNSKLSLFWYHCPVSHPPFKNYRFSLVFEASVIDFFWAMRKVNSVYSLTLLSSHLNASENGVRGDRWKKTCKHMEMLDS